MLLAIDPGLHTGIAVKDGDKYKTKCLLGEYEGQTEVLVWRLIIENYTNIEYVVIERFATSGMLSKYGLETIGIVGGVKSLCQAFGLTLHVHIPQNRYPFQKEAKELLRLTKHVIHEEDALAHLLAREYLEGQK